MSKEELRAMTDEVIANAEKRTAKAALKSIRRSRRHENIQAFESLKISTREDESSGDEWKFGQENSKFNTIDNCIYKHLKTTKCIEDMNFLIGRNKKKIRKDAPLIPILVAKLRTSLSKIYTRSLKYC